MKLILDTSFVLELKRGSEDAKRVLRESAEETSDVGISVLSLYELYVGAFYVWAKRGDAGELLWLGELLRWVTLYPLSRWAAETAARVRAEAMRDGVALPDVDLLIAVSAGPGSLLLTADEDHESMKGYLAKHGISVVYLKR